MVEEFFYVLYIKLNSFIYTEKPTDLQAKRWLGAYVTSLNNSALVATFLTN